MNRADKHKPRTWCIELWWTTRPYAEVMLLDASGWASPGNLAPRKHAHQRVQAWSEHQAFIRAADAVMPDAPNGAGVMYRVCQDHARPGGDQ